MDDGYDVLELPTPALVTVVKEINEPRIPSLKGKMKAKKAEITVLNAEAIGADPDLRHERHPVSEHIDDRAPGVGSLVGADRGDRQVR